MSRPLDEMAPELVCDDTLAERLEPGRQILRATIAAVAVAGALLAVAVVSDDVLTPPTSSESSSDQ